MIGQKFGSPGIKRRDAEDLEDEEEANESEKTEPVKEAKGERGKGRPFVCVIYTLMCLIYH